MSLNQDRLSERKTKRATSRSTRETKLSSKVASTDAKQLAKGLRTPRTKVTMDEIRALRKFQGLVPARTMRTKHEYDLKRKKAISSPDTHVRIFNYERDTEFVFERAKPEEIQTSMKIDWKLDKQRYAIGYARGLSDEVKLVKMSPEDYLEINPMPTSKDWPWEPSLKNIKKGLDEGSTFDTPFILIDNDNKVTGQEGRHRALALWRYGDREMPVAIVFNPNPS